MENKTVILKDDYTTEIGGLKISWFIGDRNNIRAEELGLLVWKKEGSRMTGNYIGEVSYWEAHAKVNNRIYQIFAYYNRITRELSEFYLKSDKSNFYYDEETFKILNKNKEIKKLLAKK